VDCGLETGELNIAFVDVTAELVEQTVNRFAILAVTRQSAHAASRLFGVRSAKE